MPAAALVLLVLLAPAGICEAQPQRPPREVGRINWDLVPEVEVFVRLIPEDLAGKTLDLTGPKGRYRNLPCLLATSDCVPNAVEAELAPPILTLLLMARIAEVRALGFPVRLAPGDQRALREFAARIGLLDDGAGRK